MPDLYASRLPLSSPLSGTGAEWFNKAIEAVKAEIQPVAGVDVSGDNGVVSPSESTVVRWRLLTAPGLEDRSWTVWWDVSQGQGDTTALTVMVGLERGRAWVIVRLGVVPRGDRLARLSLSMEPPPIVGALVEALPAEEDGWDLVAEPWFSVNLESAEGLAALLLDPQRVLPVVVVSSQGDTGPLVDAAALSRSLVGIAHVVVLDSTSASFALTNLLGPQLSVFGGAVRLYWPGLTKVEPPRNHPLWLPQVIQARGTVFRRMVVSQLMPVAVARFSGTALDVRIRAALEREHRNEAERLMARAKDASLAPEWQEELEAAWRENERLRSEVDDLVRQVAALQDNLRTMTSHWGEASAAAAASTVDTGFDQAPATVFEAVEYAAARCPHLLILEEAYDSARRSPYRQVGKLMEALVAMEDAATARERGELRGGFKLWFDQRGFDYSGSLSASTVGRFAHQYERTYDGKRVTLGPHLRLGRGSPEATCRIYWYDDEPRNLFVVGHVGHHLSDTTSG